jgi:uncharacterized protein YbaP (TraB family)
MEECMKIGKILLSVLLACLLTVTSVFAAFPPDSLEILVVEDEAYLPLRLTAYAFGAGVEWDGEQQAVLITKVNGDVVVVGVADSGGFNADGTVYVPFAFAEALFAEDESEGESLEIIVEISTPESLPQADRPQIHGALTRIEHEGNVVYIFGSMHAGEPDWFPLHPMAEAAMTRADVFAFEVDLELLHDMDAETVEALLGLQLLPDGLTLEDVLPSDVFAQFMENFDSYSILGLTYELVSGFTPVALTTLLTAIAVEVAGLDLDLSVDGYIHAFAVNNNRDIIAFEEVLGQATLIFDVPLELQAYAMIDFPDLQTLVDATLEELNLFEAYADQNMELIWQIMNDAYPTDGNPFQLYMHNIMFHQRCHIYADAISNFLQNTEEPSTLFVTIGLGHILGGNAGIVLELLEEMGFELEELWR